MKCPVCPSADLLMSERLGIEIDYCPQCRGVWLDRGELDKIIEKSTPVQMTPMTQTAPAASIPQQNPQQNPGYQDQNWGRSEHHDKHSDHGHSPYRKKSVWQELFD